MGKVYVGSSLHNVDNVHRIQKIFRDAGHEITYDWTVHGQVFQKEELSKYAIEEENGVKGADVFFMLFPARNGTHFEAGLARGLQLCGKEITIVMLMPEVDEQKTFYYLNGIHVFTDENEAISFAMMSLEGIDQQPE